MMRSLLARIRAMFRSGDMDRELDQEIESHLDLLVQGHERRGLTLEEARRAARVELGGLTSLREQHREVRGVPFLETIWQDLRYASRMIRKDRWFSAAAVAVMALGIGVNTVGFTIVDTAFFKGLPVKDSAHLYSPCWQFRGRSQCEFSGPELRELETAKGSFSSVAAYDDKTAKLSDDQAFPEEVRAVWVTTNLFATLGLTPVLGRDLTAAEERAPVALIGYDIWKNRFGGDAGVLGRTLRLDGKTATIVGVMPEGMRFPGNHQVWAPWLAFHNERETRRDSQSFDVVGRLRSGVTPDQARAELTAIGRQSTAASALKDFSGVRMRSFTDSFLQRRARNIFTVVGGAVCFVLLIACANVANLLLSRSAFRMREMAVRMSLGATRWRIVRQLLLESVLLGTIGGALGLILASVGVPLFEASLQNTDKPYWLVFTFDYRAVLYVAGICILTSVLFGLAPALRLSKGAAHSIVKEGARGSYGGRGMNWLSGSLVVTEVALAVVLLVGAGLIMRSFGNLYALDLGFKQDHLVLFGMDIFGGEYENTDRRFTFSKQIEAAVAALPGIESVAVTNGVPPRDRSERRLEIDGSAGEAKVVSTVAVTPNFLGTLGVTTLRGRNFLDRDGGPGLETVLINERLAQQFFPGEDPIGKRIRFAPSGPGSKPEAWRTIVGITPTIRQGSFQDAYLNSVVYTPHRQFADKTLYLVIRSRQPLNAISQGVKRAVQQIDPNQPLRTGQTLDQWAASEHWPFRVFGGLFVIMATIALVLSSVGLYAVMAYSVSRRTQEIGVRMALGAESRQIAWQVLRRGLWQVGMGLTLGIAGAFALSRVLSGLLVDISPNDPVTFSSIAILLAAVSLAACLVPAMRAARVDPVVALRAE
jgi:predicted permease